MLLRGPQKSINVIMKWNAYTLLYECASYLYMMMLIRKHLFFKKGKKKVLAEIEQRLLSNPIHTYPMF